MPYRDRFWAWLVAAIERLLVPRCDAVITVSDGIAVRLQELYGLSERPTVVRNLPDPAETDSDFAAPDLRRSLGMPADAPLVLHLGAVATDRGCEALVTAMAELPDAHLLFLGADDGAYAAGLEQLARRERIDDRVHFRPSVPVAQIRAHVRQASVGVSLLEDTCENHRLALPNKVFEYMAAGVPVVVSKNAEVERLVAIHGGATASPSQSESIVTALASPISAQMDKRAAPDWEREKGGLVSLYGAMQEVCPRSGRSCPSPSASRS